MQQQDGHSDCGVLAIAVATCLSNGQDPTIHRWKQAEMRQHLVNCLESKTMTPFPRSEDAIEEKGKIKIEVSQQIHCVCRRRRKKREKMRQCQTCKLLFHDKCLYDPPSKVWISNQCITSC